MKQAAEDFGMKLKESAYINNLSKEEKNMEADDQLKELLEHFEDKKLEMQKSQQDKEEMTRIMEDLRSLQAQIEANKNFQEYKRVFTEAEDFLKEVNNELSAQLGFDFGTFGGNPQGGCC